MANDSLDPWILTFPEEEEEPKLYPAPPEVLWQGDKEEDEREEEQRGTDLMFRKR